MAEDEEGNIKINDDINSNITYFYNNFNHDHSPRSVVLKWIKIAGIAIINILILGAFAAYFRNQTLSLMDVIGIVANSMGIVTGLLGIWFFFQSEELNRKTEMSLEKITTTVNELDKNMWAMIKQTFDKFVKTETKEEKEEIKLELDKLKKIFEKNGTAANPEVLGTISRLNNRIENLERKQDRYISFEGPSPIKKKGYSGDYIEINYAVIRDVFTDHKKEFPAKAKEIKSWFPSDKLQLVSIEHFIDSLIDKYILEIQKIEKTQYFSGMDDSFDRLTYMPSAEFLNSHVNGAVRFPLKY
jgi:hypothetical protein